MEISNEAEMTDETAADVGVAFAGMVRDHQGAVRLAVAQYIRCPSTVDDIAQDVFVAAFQGWHKYLDQGSLRAWLIGIARNKVRQYLRTDVRRRKRELSTFEEQMQRWQVAKLDSELDAGIAERECLSTLMVCVERLAPKSRRLIQQHYFDGETLESIARRKSQSGGALRMKLLRVRKALAKCVRDQSKVRWE